MKLTIFFLTAAFLNVYASGVSQSVTLSGKNMPLKQVFSAIEQQTGYVFFYNQEILSSAKTVSVSAQDMPLRDFLSLTLKNQPLSFRIADKTVMLSRRALPGAEVELSAAFVPASPITGQILSLTGEPLSGAGVVIKGRPETLVITDTAGRFTISASKDAILIITYVGYETYNHKVTDADLAASRPTALTIRMKQSVTELTDVVVSYNTGYQNITKERATGSFAKPDMEIFRARTGTNDIISRLDGLVAGLTVLQGPGNTVGDQTGGRTQKALVRGVSTVRLGTEPLYVLNGVQVPNFNNINPDDVADITVLKDAAAAAIWGAKAANGVIVVVTESGKNSAGLKVNYSGYVNMMGKPDLDYMHVLSSPQYIQAARETFDGNEYDYASLSRQLITPHEQILYDEFRGVISQAEANRKLDSLAAIDNTGQIRDLMYRRALTTNHTISVSGGTRIYSVYSSFSYTNSRSNLPGTKSDVYRLNINQEFHPAKNLNLSLFTSLQNSVSHADETINVGGQFLPYQLFRDANGNNISMPYMSGMSSERRRDLETRSRISLDYNPLNERSTSETNSNNLSFNITGNVGLKIWQGLSFQGSYGFQRSPNRSVAYTDVTNYRLRSQLVSFTVAPTAASTPVYYLPTTGGSLATSYSDSRNWTVRNQLVYTTALRAHRDELNFQFGQEAQELVTSTSYSILRGYDRQRKTYALLDYNFLANTGINGTVTGSARLRETPFSETERRSRFQSYYALFSYGFDKKYFVDASWRVDKSSLTGTDRATQNKPIWSFGSKWTVSKERFMQPVKWVNDLSARVTYGITGNSPGQGTAATNDILQNDYVVGPSGSGMLINTPANNTLSWESTRTINAGIDFSIFQSRISGSIEMYNKKTTSMLAVLNFNPFSGFDAELGNLGDLSNKGIEISLQTVNISKKHFNWSTGFVFSYNNNKLLSYEQNPLGLTSANAKLGSPFLVGYSMSPMFAYSYAGLDNMGDPQIRLKNGSVTKEWDMATVDDINYLGTTIPVYNGGLSNTFSYRGFSLSANIAFSFGHKMRKDMNDFFTGRLTSIGTTFSGNVNAEFANRWKKPGDELVTDIPAYVASAFDNDRRNLDYYTRGDGNTASAASVKLRDVTLRYSLPSALLKKIKVSAASFYVQTSNYLLWAANDAGIDPEFHSLSSGARSLPGYRHSVSVGTNISF